MSRHPSVSVILPAYRAWATLPATLDALEPQIRAWHDVIVVDSSGDLDHEHAPEWRWPFARQILLSDRALPGRARNVAERIATGELLAFLDADVVAEANWLQALEAAMTPDVDAVAGAVLNGTPRSPVGTAGYLLEFAEWLPGRRGPLRHGATCNLMIRRSALAELGGFAEDLWGGEDTIVTSEIARRGRLAFAPDARVRHLNRTALGEFLRHQRRLGAGFAAVCSRVDLPHRALGRPWAAPLAAPARLVTLACRLGRDPRECATAVALLPLLTAGLAAWGVGLAGARPFPPNPGAGVGDMPELAGGETG